MVGWHPTGFFPYTSGYESLQKTPELINTGCEDCHGPGEKHCTVELGHNEQLQKKLRKAVVITKAESKKQQCVTCHDLDNSPDFDFDTYYPQIEHHEEKYGGCFRARGGSVRLAIAKPQAASPRPQSRGVHP